MPNRKKPFLLQVGNILPLATSHGVGEKQIIATGETIGRPITQIARTRLIKGESVETHSHPTMDEHFYFLDGCCNVVVGKKTMTCVKGDYLFIPATYSHSIETVQDTFILTIGVAL